MAGLQLLPLAVGLIVFSTAMPVQLISGIWQTGTFGETDFLLNLLLYMPLGVALSRRPIVIVAIIAMLVSAGIEILQFLSFTRFSSYFDVAANVIGCMVGALGGRSRFLGSYCAPTIIPVNRVTGTAASLLLIMLVLVHLAPSKPSILSNWNATYSMSLGNELTGNRPWQGDIDSLTILTTAISANEARALAENSVPRFSDDVSYILPQKVSLDGTETFVVPEAASLAFAHNAIRHNAFSVIAEIETASEYQDGPARIISFSKDPYHRNFDLGQEQGTLVFRVRTPITGANGDRPDTRTADILEAQRKTSLIATYDGAFARIYVDGKLAGRSNLAAAGCILHSLCDSDVPLSQWLYGAALAFAALTIVPATKIGTCRATALAASIAGALLLRVLVPEHPMYLLGIWPDAAALAGGIFVAAALTGYNQTGTDQQ
ncbi:MAG TPA: VanZ family protein [Woeseiaceae bacterium]|nr:VanZ family protein [Woeseiaceae bacterium]